MEFIRENLNKLSFLKQLSYIEVILAIFLALSAYFVVRHWTLTLAENGQMVPVIVAPVSISPPKVLQSEDVVVKLRRKDTVPVTAISDLDQVIGKTLVHPVAGNQIITSAEIVDAPSGDLLGLKITSSLRGFYLSADWVFGRLPAVSVGDTVTIIATASIQGGKDYGGVVATRVPVIDVVAVDGAVDSLMLQLDEERSLALLRAHAQGAALQVLVDGLLPYKKY